MALLQQNLPKYIYKTEVLLFQGPHKTTNHDIRLKLNGKLLSLSNSVKYLGVHLDKFLSWNKHLENLSSKLRKTNGLISKLRHSAPKSILLQFYYAFFESHMRYACQIWGQITTNCTRIFRLQKQCLRLLTFSNFNFISSALFLELKILKLFDLIKLLNIVQIFQVLSDSAPSALINIYNLRKYPDSHLTRGTSMRLLTRPQCNTTKFGLNSVIYQSIVQWNELQTLYSGSDLAAFSKSELIKTYKSITFDEY